MKSVFGFKNRYYSKYRLLLIFRFKGAAAHAIPVLSAAERKDFFYFRHQLGELKEEGLIDIANRFDLKSLPNSLNLPDMVVSLTVKGVDTTNNYINTILAVIVGVATIIGVIHGFFKP